MVICTADSVFRSRLAARKLAALHNAPEIFFLLCRCFETKVFTVA